MRKSVLGAALVGSSCLIFAFGLLARVPAAGPGSANEARAGDPSPSRSTQTGHATASTASSSPDVVLQYGKLPLAFEPNKGQVNSEAKFVARGDGYTVFLAPGDSTALLKSDPRKAPQQVTALRMEFAGANKTAPLFGLQQLPGKSNYLIGEDPANWHTNIPNYRKVEERTVYPGVDLVYYGTQRQLEYDFLVAPDADPSVIQLTFPGANHLSVDAQGDLHITVGGNEARLHKPVAYQESSARTEKDAVASKYVLLGNGKVGFRLGHHDPSRQLIIDPILSYSTYLGGSNIDGANAIAVAPDKTAFIAGGTFSIDFPTVHPLQPNHGGPDDFSRDAFVSKLSADGSTLLYSTYLGGKNEDVANGIAVDSFGDAYVTGTTLSPDFPVTPDSFNPACGGDDECGAKFSGGPIVSNAFVTKLNPEGSGLVYSGYLGEFEHVKGQAIAVDANQVAYVTGETEANFASTVPNLVPPPFPITANAAQPSFGGGTTDAFLTQISATGRTILYSTYVGGSNEDSGLGVAVDGTGNAYVTGLSYSADFPVTGSAFQGTNGGAGDAFLVKINTAGGPFVYSTLLGGSGLDQGNSVAVDATGNAFITGETGGSIGAVASPRPYGGSGDAFVARFNPSLSGSASLIYFTYLGGSLADAGQGIAVDSNGNAYVTGSTVSTDFPVTSAVFQHKYGGGNADAFVTKLDPAGATLLYSSYLGGTNTDIGYGIAVDSDGSAYVAGQTCSLDFPLANPEQATPGGNCDAFVSKVSILNGIQLNPAGLVFTAQSLGTSSQPQTVTLTNGDNSVTISGISVTGANARDFVSTNTCPSSLAPGAQCTISVTFTPTGAGVRKASITVADNAPGSPQVLDLTGQSSTLTLSASNLFFGNQQVGVPSNALAVTATNNGTTAVTFSGIAASGDYSESSNCMNAPLQPSTNCVINVTFTPSSTGSSVGALTLADNAPGSPQIVLLTGTGFVQQADFTMSVVQPFASIPAGQSANFSLLVGSVGGFSQPVTLGCSGLPRNASCVASANQVTPTAPATPFTVTITTGLRAGVPPGPGSWHAPFKGPWILALGLTGLLLLMALTIFGGIRIRLATAAVGLAVILMLGSSGCNSGNQAGVPAGTPAGSYQITVTGTSGAVRHTTVLNLQVN